ncbi:hypothetical protein CO661_17240 [Sinorhizobium fredii]|uniref:PD-(D/E)XK nuclease superfamily protein n=1 Tax=Rhizobium fredii TaxID=380 RepID=A0A2A6LVR4_RHIFR|nr:hypothetical protein [Sinorhizobium fredii]PDT46654.1 hypothetical protein CO661_17240 [Sinorhizobium fredii]
MDIDSADVTTNFGMSQTFQNRVRERDLDNFLVEELQASTVFQNWFLSRLSPAFTAPEECELRLEKSPARLQDARQTDVRVGWFNASDELVACVLIESKVTADFQPGQAEAYASERDGYRATLGQGSAAAVITAPAERLARLAHAQSFDHALAIEDIIDMLAGRRSNESLSEELDARLAARIALLEALCGKRPFGGWVPTTVAEKRSFALAYAELAREVVPHLTLRPSTDGPKALTRIFEGLPVSLGFPRTVIRHEFGSKEEWKYVNLQIAGAAEHAAAFRTGGLIEGTGFAILEAGKSLSVRVSVPGIDPTLAFDDEKSKVRLGLKAVDELAVWFREHQTEIERIISG